MNIPSNGYSVGNLATTTISGTVPYRTSYVSRNARIRLFIVDEYTAQAQKTLLFVWFLRDCTIYNNSSVTFTGVDAMAFTGNKYSLSADATIGTHFQFAEQTITSLCGMSVSIDRPSSDILSATPLYQESWDIKSLMGAGAAYDCANYHTECSLDSLTLKKTTTSEVDYTLVGDDKYAPLTIGISQSDINRVRVFPTNMEMPVPNTAEHETLADYDVYEFNGVSPTSAGTLSIVTPFIQYSQSTAQFSALLGRSFGTQFSCAKLKVPYNEFFIPMSRIIFDHNSNLVFYICSAEYVLTSDGLYASISGSARAVSDYEYVGETETTMQTKFSMNHNYRGTAITKDGIVFAATRATQDVDSGASENMGDSDKYGVVPLGHGLFGLGNDIVCSQPLLSKDETHKGDTPIHKVTYEYTDFYIDIAWTETTQGKMEDIQWLRRWKT